MQDTNTKELIQLEERFQTHYDQLEEKYKVTLKRVERELKLRGRVNKKNLICHFVMRWN